MFEIVWDRITKSKWGIKLWSFKARANTDSRPTRTKCFHSLLSWWLKYLQMCAYIKLKKKKEPKTASATQLILGERQRLETLWCYKIQNCSFKMLTFKLKLNTKDVINFENIHSSGQGDIAALCSFLWKKYWNSLSPASFKTFMLMLAK